MADPTGSPETPIPECDVERLDNGTYRVRHKRTGDVEVVDTPERVILAGVLLRVIAAWPKPSEPPFRTGDLP
ncbi:hypothetical protein E1295_31770 [Nonomuraea mesophila]|uniref:Uncharacterized protein n=1 Tax=Nonomuraea mesophila TaxID=2530382 RepID=A0A4R5F013_9ACTN|nr:hypothetical protein [Nonomuraea mesophila]TDE40480.1 hypothetical protein E1295_31770 [Nonomuraea mesophila]